MAEHAAAKPNASWPIFSSLTAFSLNDLPGDLIAGITLAAIAIPEQMATARLGGFSPQIGFFAFIAGSLGFAMFGSNRFLSCGADSTITPIFAGGLTLMAASGSPHYQALAAALALLVGLVLVVGDLFRLGWIANLLSTPVTVGFLVGISAHILVSQMPVYSDFPRRADQCFNASPCSRSISERPTSIRSVSGLVYLPWSPARKPSAPKFQAR
jgi:sulfate permease, SulP family